MFESVTELEPSIDWRHDLGPLGDALPPALCAPPLLHPVPLGDVPGPLVLPYPVIVGSDAGGEWACRHDCWMVTRPEWRDGRQMAGVAAESQLAVGGSGDGRAPRFWWAPVDHLWIERPTDVIDSSRHLNRPGGRRLRSAVDADALVGRPAWLAHESGWHLVVAVSNVGDDELVTVVRRRTWWRWAATGELPPDAAFAVESAAVWLE